MAQGGAPADDPHQRDGHQPGPVWLPALVRRRRAGRSAARGGAPAAGRARAPSTARRESLALRRRARPPPPRTFLLGPPQGHDPHLPQRLPVPEQGHVGAGRHLGARRRRGLGLAGQAGAAAARLARARCPHPALLPRCCSAHPPPATRPPHPQPLGLPPAGAAGAGRGRRSGRGGRRRGGPVAVQQAQVGHERVHW